MDKGEELRYLMLAVQREGNRRLTDALHPLRLTPSQAEVLIVLNHYEPMTLTELGERLVCETGLPSRLINSMIKKGLVEKTALAADRRVSQLRMTRSARALLPRLESIDTAFNRQPTAVLDDAALDLAVSLLWRIAEGTVGGEAIRKRQTPRE